MKENHLANSQQELNIEERFKKIVEDKYGKDAFANEKLLETNPKVEKYRDLLEEHNFLSKHSDSSFYDRDIMEVDRDPFANDGDVEKEKVNNLVEAIETRKKEIEEKMEGVIEKENILSLKEFKPDHPISLTVNQIKEVETMLEEQGLDPSKNVEVSALLDQHFLKVEKLLADFHEKLEKGSHEDLPQMEESLKGKLNRVFTDLKDGLKQLFVDMKDQVRSGIENKVNDVKLNIHNAVAEKVQGVNSKIKNLTTTLDEKYQVIEKNPEKEPVQEAKKQEVPELQNRETSPEEPSEMMREIEKLKQQNKGLKTFVEVVKTQHPAVFKEVRNTMNNAVSQSESQAVQSEVKSKVKEPELQL
ncbi:hypothetical protein [Bacillus gobiensis]|uniref:hypothetical protein n=1 Tax=Bacillus gobiensis TaxID=1441095 RepID=UPI003D1ACE5D